MHAAIAGTLEPYVALRPRPAAKLRLASAPALSAPLPSNPPASAPVSGSSADLGLLIVAIAHRGDRQAFARLFEHFAPRVKAYLLKLGTTPEAAEELAQETLLTLWRRASYFDPTRAAASTWVFAIARNLRIDLARRERRPLPGEIHPAQDDVVRPDQVLEAAQDAGRVSRAMGALTEDQAAVIRLAFWGDKPHSEIALDLALPLGTVKSRIRLAMGRLRAALEDGA